MWYGLWFQNCRAAPRQIIKQSIETLVSAKWTYILNGGDEILHQQSMEWLSEIAFWKDEAAFLYALLVNKKLMPLHLRTPLVRSFHLIFWTIPRQRT